MTDLVLRVLIPTHGRAPLLARTLDSLAACRLPDAYAETVVVENGSRDGAEQIVTEAARTHPALRLRYLHVERANKSHALNVALETMADGLVVFFDDDIRIEPGALDAYARAAAAGPGHFFGGPIHSDFETVPPDWLLPLLPASARGFTLADAADAGYYLGANWAAFASDLRAAGGFDPNYGPGSPTGARGQESEMQRRLRRQGVLATDVPEAVVWHHVPAARCSPRWAIDRSYRTGRSQGAQARAGSSARLVRAGLKALPIEVARLALGSLRGHAGQRVTARASLAYWRGYFLGLTLSTDR
jgi:GT2 family glycosyltransferase